MPLKASVKERTRSTSNPFKNRSQPVTPVTPNTPVSPKFPRLRPPVNVPRQNLPAWDRSFDAVCHSATTKASFEKVLSSFFENHGRKKPSSGYFRLPDSVRLQICRHLLPDNHKPLRLNKFPFNRDVWRTQDFASPYSTLGQISPYLEVSFAFRADVLVAFLLETRLHAVFSPFIGPRVSPLATTWLNDYGSYASNIVVELDMSHLACGPTPDAAYLLANTEKTALRLKYFVEAQLQRSESCPIESLVLLCRRFFGKRPIAEEPEPSSTTTSRPPSRGLRTPEPYSPRGNSLKRHNSEPDEMLFLSPVSSRETFPDPLPLRENYCPDGYLLFCNNILRLKGRIASIRMCGFSEDYSTRLIGTLFTDQKNVVGYRITPSTIWPKLSGQKSYIDLSGGIIALDEHEAPTTNYIPEALRKWEGCVQLPPPHIDANGNFVLPAFLADLQQARDGYLRSETSLSERTCDELSREFANKSTISEKRGFAWIKEPFIRNKLKKKKRHLSRDAAITY